MSAGEASIGAHACLGDGRSAALVSRAGDLDALCWPRFDSPALFAGVLDARRGGSWRVAPAVDARVARRYLPDTNVLETRWEAAGGAVTVLDLMTVASEEEKRAALLPQREVLRVVCGERGEVPVEVRLEARPGFGREAARVEDAGRLGWRVRVGSRAAWLRSEVPLVRVGGVLRGHAVVRAGETVAVSLSLDDDAPAVLPPLGAAVADRVARTVRFWRTFAGRARYAGPWRDEVVRSVLAMKLLSYAPSGALVAAATTSLPERPGGDLNWDYRFAWLRDAAFTARAFLALGYAEEAFAFCDWLVHTTRLTWPELGILYDVYGRPPPPERELPWLSGHRGARPVRVGNAAAGQRQLDCYGEVVDAVSQLVRAGRPLDRDTAAMLRGYGDVVAARWAEPDQGIWEGRGPPQPHLHSRVLAWVALDRLLDLHGRGQLPRARVEAWAAARRAIRRDVLRRGWSPALGSYTRLVGGDDLDASLLLLSFYGFHHAGGPRMAGTFRRVRERLRVGPGLYLRNEGSREAGEGAFGICAFWAADHLARGGGAPAEARAAFEEALRWRNDLGLFAEEVDPATGEALGNFPQAYTHVGLVNAALTLEARARGAHAGPRRGRDEARAGAEARP